MKLTPILAAAALALAVGPAAYAKECPPRPAKLSLPDGATVNTVKEDVQRRGLLFAGTVVARLVNAMPRFADTEQNLTEAHKDRLRMEGIDVP